MRERTIELLAPAGDMERLRMAVAYGADAVYLAGTTFGMRSFAGNFTPEELGEAVKLCRSKGVRVHVTCNTMPRNEEIARLPEWLEYLNDVGVDAIILADVGVLSLAKRYAPKVACHISTQASIVNYVTARAWYDLGASRVILARELSLDEIREIRAKTPRELEMEAFAHGAMCVSYSGRCLLSNYMTGRDSNRGACAQPCRYKYALMEEKRPGEYFPVSEDERGTYIMNSRDMCMIDHVPELMEAGLDSLKLEGRAKSAYYAAIVTGAYRHAIDAAAAGEPLDPVWRDEVEHISHRHYSTGFFYGQPGQFTQDSRYIRDWQIVAKVESCDETGRAVLTLNNKFRAGDVLELVGPDVRPQTLTAEGLWDQEGNPLEEVRKPQMRFVMKLPRQVPPLSLLRRQADLSPQ
ncbi:peptidase U32 family protein [Pseudoflavonifractor phocaeensis]|uniref:peptidase U32 family protein n=1 Tax=Pseudoflavonifractor phocaeensis TaxID=1870988 RepID=UPI001F366BDD|nr:U32 family peptidase [Pseudoflavonifractor phocaeensis]MCF2597058.1 U32 family peptidase [Pseudoflavonifractor phocaeensis]